MDAKTEPTVEMSLGVLSDAIGKAADDFRGVRPLLERSRANIASRNTAISRSVISAAERVIDNLKRADEALKDVLVALEERD